MDHPRRCGENANPSPVHIPGKGSPPQVRGKLLGQLAGVAPPRITPAGAGKTRRAQGFLRKIQDHPRRCGENLRLTLYLEDGYRITPAGAGKTLIPPLVDASTLDHPRRCGENLRPHCPTSGYLGSPPQVRGKPAAEQGGGGIPRITPADAGKTTLAAWMMLTLRDHPRGCGENNCSTFLEYEVSGSPPRMRGKQL